MLGFLIGLVVGGIIGVIFMAMMNIASQNDNRMASDEGAENEG